jgi:phosphatidylglycerol:prolipoprotein diacylglycerol transferase
LEYFLWEADPVLLHLGPLQLRWYGLFFVGSFFLGMLMMRWIFKREGRDPSIVDDGMVYMLVGAVVGARLMHCLAYEPDYYLAHPIEILKVWKGGLASHGGLIGVLIATWLFARKHRLSYLWLLSRIAIPGALVAAFIRLGNFFNSEIIGIPTDKPWAVVFSRIDTLPRHPVQLYESLAYLMLFLLFWILYLRLKPTLVTRLFPGLFLVLVFTIRFFLEYVKTRQADYQWNLPLSTGQALSIPFILLGIGWIIWALRTPVKSS